MGVEVFDDPFGTQSVTPGIGSLKKNGSYKLLVVIFVVDCSKTMSGDRIGAVNAALQELKYKLTEIKNDNSLELKVAIMSLASNAKWELQLTPIEEVSLSTIHTRPGLTEYGAAFHELNKVLRKDAYMKHMGKIAPPAIMFLTDGEPEDDYQADLDELLKNAWFTNASRSAVLLGDAIYNESAKDVVRQFVNDAQNDIVTAEDSTVIIQKIKLATMHTVAGEPIQGADENPFDPKASVYDKSDTADGHLGDTSVDTGNPFGDFIKPDDLYPFDEPGGDDSTFGSAADDSSAAADTQAADPFGGNSVDDDNPFGSMDDDDNPFGDGGDPFGGLI